MMMSRNSHFGTAELVKGKKNTTLAMSIEQVIRTSKNRGIQIHIILDTKNAIQKHKHEQIMKGTTICTLQEHVAMNISGVH